jgi:hypothetical protein
LADAAGQSLGVFRQGKIGHNVPFV